MAESSQRRLFHGGDLMNYQAFTNDSLTMMYQGVRGALAADDALSELGKESRFRVRETPEWSCMPLISKRRCTGAEWFSRSSTGQRFSLRCPSRDNGLATQRCLVGAAGFEPTTCSTQNCRATRLRYTPIVWETTSIHA